MTKQTAIADPVQGPDIYRYHDYRTWLSDQIAYLKSLNRNFSQRSISRAAGLASGLLPMVLTGKRKLSDNNLEKLLPYLQIDASAGSFFRLLVTLDESENDLERRRALKAIQRFGGYRHKNRKETEVYRYLSSWYCVAIREMALMPGFVADPAWISQQLRFRISKKNIAKALEFLKSNDFIRVARNGSVSVPEKVIDCESGVYRIALADYHRQMFDLASESIESVSRESRKLSGHMVAVRKEDFQKIDEILSEARDRIEELGREVQMGEVVYYVGLQAIPLTTYPEKKDEGEEND